jgi:hypothetical protein
MSPYVRSGLTFLAVGAALTVFFVIHWSLSAGVFNRFEPVSPGVCRVLASIPGPEDFAIDPLHRVMFVSSADRRAPAAGDGLYLVGLDDPKAPPVRLAGTPPDFHPQGISLYRGPDGEVLFAINRRSTGANSIETFAVSFADGTATLTSQSSIAGGLLVSPHDIFAISPNQFYVSNDHVTHTALGRFAEDYLLWPHADLLFFNGSGFRIAVQRIASPSGILVSPDLSHVYLASANERRLIAFSRNIFSGDLSEVGALSIPARLDKITRAANGDLIVAGQPSLLKARAFAGDPGKPAPSSVFRVSLGPDGAPRDYRTIYANEGAEIGAAGSAALQDGHLFIGAGLDRKLLDCAIK